LISATLDTSVYVRALNLGGPAAILLARARAGDREIHGALPPFSRFNAPVLDRPAAARLQTPGSIYGVRIALELLAKHADGFPQNRRCRRDSLICGYPTLVMKAARTCIGATARQKQKVLAAIKDLGVRGVAIEAGLADAGTAGRLLNAEDIRTGLREGDLHGSLLVLRRDDLLIELGSPGRATRSS